MQNDDICWMSAVDLAEAIGKRKLSPLEVVKNILDRIDALNPRINAFVTMTAETALAEAKAAEVAVSKGERLGPLHGVPVSIKDLIFTRGVRTTMGSKLYRDFVPDEDAVLVSRLKDAGAIVLGKTNTPEFGLKMLTDNLVFGATRNPWNLERSPGGSSGGAAGAVATGLGPLAAGNDGGGSIRTPSSCCGVFGIKPQFGRVPRYPILHGADILTHEGPIARTVEDAALMLDVMAGQHWGDPYSLPGKFDARTALREGVKGLKIAWSPDLGHAEVDPEVADICARAAAVFSELGAEVEEASPAFESPEAYHSTLYVADTLAFFSSLGSPEELAAQLDPLTATVLYVGTNIKATDYARSVFAKQDLAASIGGFLQSYDLLLTPTLAYPPPPVQYEDAASFLKWLPFITPFNMTGQPAASVPAGWTDDGLPVGLQIVGRACDEPTVLRAAASFEEARPWRHVRPPIAEGSRGGT
jgi:Asp-tRNA(Asn)/Glu-tRNA(Gln) amidotransferase A subunit family amidase